MWCQVYLCGCLWSIGVYLFGVYPFKCIIIAIKINDLTWWLAQMSKMELIVDHWTWKSFISKVFLAGEFMHEKSDDMSWSHEMGESSYTSH